MEVKTDKLDMAKLHPAYYKATKLPQIVDLNPHYYLSFEGQCAPDNPYFLGAIEHIYAVSYTIKFLSKAEDNDFTVPKMEGLWWVTGGVESQKQFLQTPKNLWCWKIMIRMPDFIEELHYFRAIELTKDKKKSLNFLEKVRFELFNEGTSAQILHLGSYDNETPTIEKLHRFIEQEGMKINGYHHEIYLSDPGRTSPEKLKTIIRYPITIK